jgi:hypothetical protein
MLHVRVLAAMLALKVLAVGAAAARLDPTACDGLRVEQSRLVDAGVRRNLERGPDWARSNLNPDALEQVRKLMELNEQLIFRCTEPALRPTQVDAGAAKAGPAKSRKQKVKAGEQTSDGDGAPKPADKKSRQKRSAKAGDSSQTVSGEAPVSKTKANKAAAPAAKEPAATTAQ